MKSITSDRETAHELVRKARSIVWPNPGFIQQLEHYEEQILFPNDNTKHVRHQTVVEKIASSFPVKASIVKVCRPFYMEGCRYLEGSQLEELLDDIKVVVNILLDKYVRPYLDRVFK
jgi:hypothetical protein